MRYIDDLELSDVNDYSEVFCVNCITWYDCP